MEVQIIEQKRYCKALVESESQNGAWYIVELNKDTVTCTCPHNEKRGTECKHIRALKEEISW